MPPSLTLPTFSSSNTSNYIQITLTQHILHASFAKLSILKIWDNPYINLSPSLYTSIQITKISIAPIRIGITNKHGSMPSSYKIKTIAILGFSTSIMSWILQISLFGSSNGGSILVVMLTTSKAILWLRKVTSISKIIFDQLLLKGSFLPFSFFVS